jgi:hypothetical protein
MTSRSGESRAVALAHIVDVDAVFSGSKLRDGDRDLDAVRNGGEFSVAN